MGAEAFREGTSGCRSAVWGLIGLVGRGGVVGAAVEPLHRRLRRDRLADNFGLFVTLTLVVVGVLTILFSSPVVERDGLPAGEYYALVLFAIVGMMMMATATDLLVIFIALEILSLAVYVLTSIRRDNASAPRRRSSTSCSARSRARSSSTASPSPTASPAARG